jgi:O-methyltransferase involved in polyketide biosynthesis
MAGTDNDSWDLASSVGATATAVDFVGLRSPTAASRALASKGPDALLDDPLDEGTRPDWTWTYRS